MIIDDKAPPANTPASPSTPAKREHGASATPAGPVTDYADTQAASDAAEVERVVESLGAKANQDDDPLTQDLTLTPDVADSSVRTPGEAAGTSADAADVARAPAAAEAVADPLAADPLVENTPAESIGTPPVTFSDSGPLLPDATVAVAPPAPLIEASDAGLAQTDPNPANPSSPTVPSEPSAPPLPAYLHRSDNGWSVFKRIVVAKTRQLTDRLSRRITDRTLRIGISARIFHPQPGGKGLQSKTLQYLEESIAHWVMTRNALVFMVPTVNQDGAIHPSDIRMRDYAQTLDGLVLQGGADVSPMSYSQSATRPEWNGDRVRDRYELELLQAFIDAGKPVLGICRGCQLINVAFGGTLHQDIATELPESISHVNDHYDANWHEVRFTEGSTLPALFDGQRGGIVNSIHHQSVNKLGRDLTIEAVSPDDNVVEAIRLRRVPFVVGLQWHPEFHSADTTSSLLNCTPILDQFLRAARETRF